MYIRVFIILPVIRQVSHKNRKSPELGFNINNIWTNIAINHVYVVFYIEKLGSRWIKFLLMKLVVVRDMCMDAEMFKTSV